MTCAGVVKGEAVEKVWYVSCRTLFISCRKKLVHIRRLRLPLPTLTV